MQDESPIAGSRKVLTVERVSLSVLLMSVPGLSVERRGCQNQSAFLKRGRNTCGSRWDEAVSMTEKSSNRQLQIKLVSLRKAAPLLFGCVLMLNPGLRTPNFRSASPAGSANVSDTDISVKPGDDFYRYANGGWMARNAIPAGQQRYDTRAILAASTRERVRNLIQGAATEHAAKGSVTQKVGDYYASYMDVSVIDSRGMAPLSDEQVKIAAIDNKTALSAYLGSTLNREVDGLITNADHVFGLWVNQGFEDADHNLPHLWQGGLGLPSRDNYLDTSAAGVELRSKYQAHIAAVLKLAGSADAETRQQVSCRWRRAWLLPSHRTRRR